MGHPGRAGHARGNDLAGCFPRLQVPLHPLRFRRFSSYYWDPDGLQQTANRLWRQLVPADVPQINAGNERLSWFTFHGAN